MASVGKLSTFKERVMRRVGSIDAAKFIPDDPTQNDLIEAGLAAFDQRRPRTMTFETAGDDASRRFVLSTLIAGWKDGTMRLLTVARVHDANIHNEFVEEYDVGDWKVTKDTTGKDVLQIVSAVGAGLTLRVTYSRPHAIDSEDIDLTSVPDGDTELLTLLCAREVCRWISRSASDMADNSLGADQVDFGAIGERFADRAKELLRDADQLTSPSEETQTPGGGSVAWNTKGSFGDRFVGH